MTTESHSGTVKGVLLCTAVALAAAAGIAFAEQRRRALLEESTVRQETIARTTGQAFLDYPSFAAFGQAIEAARRKAERDAQGEADRMAILQEADRAWESAQAQFKSDAAAAEQSALKALQGYVALCMWRFGMTYIPGGTTQLGAQAIETPPFLIETGPVSVQEFRDFLNNVEDSWRRGQRMRAEGADGSQPQTGVTFYDAQAYAAHHGMLIPTTPQWLRAFSQFKENETAGAIGSLPQFAEWTRTAAGHEGESAYMPYFEDSLTVFEVYRSDDNNGYTWQPFSVRFADSRPNLGFRCVYEIPTAPGAVDRIVNP